MAYTRRIQHTDHSSGNAGTNGVDRSGETAGAVVTCEHRAQFYESEDFLVRILSDFIGEALQAGEAAVVLATEPHRRRLDDALLARGLDVPGLAARGQYLALDAAGTLDKFMRAGRPDAARFAEVVGAIIAQAGASGRPVRAFGEMVAVLWERGGREAAIEVERLWNELGKVYAFVLLCAYPMEGFGDEASGEFFQRICACHSAVRPAESYAALADPDERLRAISRLQQRAQSLEQEIARRKKLEEELSRRERELSDFVDNAVEGLHKVNEDGLILWANRAELRLLGYEAEEYLGRHIGEFHADPETIADILLRLGRGEALHNYPARLRARDGSIKHVHISSNAHFEEGRLVYTRCFTRDVTARRQAEESLRQNEERMRRLLNLLPAGVYTCEAPSGRIQFYNRRAAELWGREPKLGDTAERFCGSFRLFRTDNVFLPHADCPMAGVLAGGPAVRDQEIIVERPDGSRFTAAVNIDPITDVAARVIGAVNVFQDITGRKKVEMQLREAKAEAEEASRAKDQFLAVLSHELRTPLTPVLMAVSGLESDLEISPRLRSEFAMMRRNIALEIRLIDDLLDLSRIVHGKLALRVEETGVHALVHTAAQMVAADARANRLTIELALGATHDRVNGDAARLHQVLWNLLHNAIKFSSQNGRIAVRSRNEKQCLVVEVEDTGLGIEASALPHVFDAFAQADQSVGRNFGGLGLGLAIAKAVIDRHGGSIQAFSPGRGCGSRFTLRLPVTAENPDLHLSDTGLVKSNSPPSQRRILLVDDHVDTLNVMHCLLKGAGYVVTKSGSVTEAEEHLRGENFDLLISDLSLPDGTGFDVMACARQRFPELPGIALSGYGMDKDIANTSRAGFNAHLVKPVEIERLKATIHELIGPVGR